MGFVMSHSTLHPLTWAYYNAHHLTETAMMDINCKKKKKIIIDVWPIWSHPISVTFTKMYQISLDSLALANSPTLLHPICWKKHESRLLDRLIPLFSLRSNSTVGTLQTHLLFHWLVPLFGAWQLPPNHGGSLCWISFWSKSMGLPLCFINEILIE